MDEMKKWEEENIDALVDLPRMIGRESKLNYAASQTSNELGRDWKGI
jgi:hypothetical protein